MWRGLASLLAKLAAKQAAKKSKNVVRSHWQQYPYNEKIKRLPESLEFLRGWAHREKMPAHLKMVDPSMTPKALKEALKNLPTHVDTVPMRASIGQGTGKVKNLFRGETLYPEEQFISKTGLEAGQGVKPGQWWTIEPFEAAGYSIRPSKIYKAPKGTPNQIIGKSTGMGEGITNPGVIRRMKVNKNIEDLESIRNRGTGWSHFHPTDKMIGESKISMFYSVINRLREMGWENAQIFKYIGQIMKKKNVAGKRDWMLYNRGGKV